MARGNQLDRQWRLLQLIDQPAGVTVEDAAGARIPFAKAAAPYIRERLWHPTQRLRDLPDGRLKLQIADTQEVRRFLLGWGAQAEVLQPTAMREALRQEALAMVEKLGRRGPGLARVRPSESSRPMAASH